MDLTHTSFKESTAPTATAAAELRCTAEQIHHANTDEAAAIEAILARYKTGGAGFVPSEKEDNYFALLFENFNSFGLNTTPWKHNRLNQLIRQYKTDFVCGVELQTNWPMAPPDKQFEQIIGRGKARGSVTANNKNERIKIDQQGGVGIMALGRVSNMILARQVDETGLGRWASLLVGTMQKKTRIVTAYQPTIPAPKKRNKSSTTKQVGWGTVWAQHLRYFRGTGNPRYRQDDGRMRSPRSIWFDDLIASILLWKRNGEEIILLADVNENIYTGRFATRLRENDILMTELFRDANGSDAPASHIRGSTAICGAFATPGIVCPHVFHAPHKSGLGDHRYHVLHISASSMIGEDYPHLVSPAGRKLTCKIERVRKSYNKVLLQLTERHRMFAKMSALQQDALQMDSATFILRFNQWDREMSELMHSAEDKSSKFKHDDIEFSPVVGIWLNRLRIYKYIRRFKSGLVPDPRNLFRACQRAEIPQPRSITPDELEASILACETKLKQLKQQAPLLRHQHLQNRLISAQEKEDDDAIREIIRILKREANQKEWRNLRSVTKPRTGGAAIAIKVRTPTGETHYTTQEGVEQGAASVLQERFCLGRRAPMCSGQLFSDIGYIGDTAATQSILEGTYSFPPDTDEPTMFLLREASKIYNKMSTVELSSFVSTEDFQYSWKHINENIQSSRSGLHFAHYKAAAHCDYLSALHAAKLSLAASTGMPLDRWGDGLTVLLEKLFGVIYMEKMRAICLFEADFNGLNKLIFAKRMMTAAHEQGIVPVEQFATKGTTSEEGGMGKLFKSDLVRVFHFTAAIESVDLGDCYDAVAHPCASIALQAFGVKLPMVKTMLTCLQTMKFYLRTGFGEATTPYGGTTANPTFGLGQGNGAAPPAFSAVSTLMVNAYRSLGHGIKFFSAYSLREFVIAAILYVDDTDLMHWDDTGKLTDDQFLAKVQDATMAWGKLVQATGGSLKPAKCFWYMIAWKFENGTPRMKKLRQLPATPVRIPQPDGSEVEIELKELTNPSETLGIHCTPSGDGSKHLAELLGKGLKWVDQLRTGYLKPRSVWLSFTMQLQPKIFYGLVALMVTPKKLEITLHKIYYQCLPFLGVNRHITRDWRMISKRYQGLGMPNPNVILLSRKLVLLLRHWNMPNVMGNFLLQVYEAFRMETGLGGNIFERPYKKFQRLATHTWMKHLWQLLDYLSISLRMHQVTEQQPIRVGDATVMDKIIETEVYDELALVRINRVRKYKKVHWLSELVQCDGIAISQEIMTNTPGDSKYKFSREQPTRGDFDLWQQAIHAISSPSLSICPKLGRYLRDPPTTQIWFVSEDRSHVYRWIDDDSYAVLTPPPLLRRTRHGTTYRWTHSCLGTVPPSDWASVHIVSQMQIQLHSSTPQPLIPDTNSSFLDVLASFENQSLWKFFKCDGDGEWIKRGLLMGTIAIGHDGSYMPKVHPNVCAGAVLIVCRRTKQRASCTVVEHHKAADNYRGELLAALLAQLILRAATSRASLPYKPLRCDSDNMGVVIHGNHPSRPLKADQVQADVLRVFKYLVRTNPIQCTLRHVHSHMDKLLEWDQLSFRQQVNCQVDELVQDAILAGVENEIFMHSDLPFEEIRVYAGRDKLTSSPKKELARFWSYSTARDLYNNRKIVSHRHFHLICWDAVECAMQKFPQMFQTWVTKQVSHFCGTNRHLSNIDPSVENTCPSCGETDEAVQHITRCSDPGRVTTFVASVASLVEWMEEKQTEQGMIDMIEVYLLARGHQTMCETVSSTSPYHRLARYHDKLGWDNFLEGRFCTLYVELHRRHLRTASRWNLAESWARELSGKLLQITHRQWLYRNATVHFTSEGRNIRQHEEIIRKVNDLRWIDPDDLLPESQHLLTEDFTLLHAGHTEDKEHWIAEMESAMAAAASAHARQRQRHHRPTTPPRNLPDSSSIHTPITNDAPPIALDGGTLFKGVRKK
jgi:hypothetical protein